MDDTIRVILFSPRFLSLCFFPQFAALCYPLARLNWSRHWGPQWLSFYKLRRGRLLANKLRWQPANLSSSAAPPTAPSSPFLTTITCPAFTSPSSAVPTAAASSTRRAPTAPISMAQRFRRPCSPPATKSSPAKPFSLCASFRTTNSPQIPPAQRLSLNRQALLEENFPVQLPLRLANLSLRALLPLPRPNARTRPPTHLRLPHQSKIAPPNVQSPQLQGLPHRAPHYLRAPANLLPSPSAVGPFARFPMVGKSKKVLAFNKM